MKALIGESHSPESAVVARKTWSFAASNEATLLTAPTPCVLCADGGWSSDELG